MVMGSFRRIRRTRLPRTLLSAAVTAGVVGSLITPGVAAQAVPSGCSVVASGLTAPRFVAVADDGAVYVSEAGSGGTEVLPAPPVEGGPPGGGPPPTRGNTGQVTRIGTGGAKTVVASGLPSYAGAEGIAGPVGLVASGGSLFLAIGGAGPATAMLNALPNENSVVRINPQTGAVSRIADIGALERADNPAGGIVDSNLYGLAMGGDGNLYVADAGGNTLYRVNPNNNQATLVTAFGPLTLPPGAAGPPQLEPVPTGVAPAATGNDVHVGFLSGGPFPQGAAKVVRVTSAGQVSDTATNLTAVVDVTLGPDRNLYVTEIFSQFNFMTQPPTLGPGRVRRIAPNGTSQIVVDGLTTPTGIAFDRSGNLYIVSNSAFTPPGAQGQLLRCDRIAAPAVALPRTGNADGAVPDGWDVRFGLAGAASASLIGGLFFITRRSRRAVAMDRG